MMMMKLELTARAGSWLAAFGRCATAWFVASGIPLAHVAHAERAAPVPALPALQPLFDYPLRDTSICVGGDGLYYLTGTTGAPDWWAVTGDIQVWKSSDLATWTPVVEHPRRRSVVWNIDREGTWEKPIPLRDGAPFRPLWAPEITYLKGTYWIAYSIPLGVGGGLLKSTTGKPEGPYESVWKERPLVHAIDLALFEDDDGKVYLIWADGQIAQLNDDLTAFAEKPWKLKPRDADLLVLRARSFSRRTGATTSRGRSSFPARTARWTGPTIVSPPRPKTCADPMATSFSPSLTPATTRFFRTGKVAGGPLSLATTRARRSASAPPSCPSNSRTTGVFGP